MSTPGPIRESIEFASLASGRRLRCVAQPARSLPRGAVLLLPPFAEELNKTRRMCARFARELAAEGWRVVRIDLFGCGDSEGDFSGAAWGRWVDDLRAELAHQTTDVAAPVWLWALRAGALFVPALLEAAPNANLLLWQPVLSGQSHLQQFLRLHAAAALLGPGRAQPSAPTPAQRLEAGETVEIGGYQLPPALALGLKAATFAVPASYRGAICWLEVSATGDTQAPPGTARAIERLREQGCNVRFEIVSGGAFWQSVEIEENEDLLTRSRRLLDEASPVTAPLPTAPGTTQDIGESVSSESALCFSCAGTELAGVVHAAADPSSDIGVVIVVGGPQYRVGSHRQFVDLSRALARAGFHTLRFDCRGMGDSGGATQTFQDHGPDLVAAVGALQRYAPRVRRVVLWGLCDAASVAMMQAARIGCVAGMVIANPWVRSSESLATATVKHYYRGRLMQGDLWRKLLSGRFDWGRSIRSLGVNLAAMLRRPARAGTTQQDFRIAMARGLGAFKGQVLLLLSGEDLTAREFVEYTSKEPEWAGLLARPRVQRVDLADADHTFSRRVWKSQVEEATVRWIRDRLCTP